MVGNDEVYLGQIHPKDAKVLEELTTPKNWDYDGFKRVMIVLATLGRGQSVPSRNRPDSIHLQGLRPFIDKMVVRTKKTGNEHAQPALADIDKKSIVMGRVTEGKQASGRMDLMKQPGREMYQRLVGSIHTHPGTVSPETVHGFSHSDYNMFLEDRSQQFMMISWGEEERLLVLKTSVTPNNLRSTSVETRVNACYEDFFQNGTDGILNRVVNFNKAVCIEFGLTLYKADKRSRDLFERVNVAS